MTITEQLDLVGRALRIGRADEPYEQAIMAAGSAALATLRESVAGLELKLSAILAEAVLVTNESTETEKERAGWERSIRVLALTCGWPGSLSSRHPWGYITEAVQRAETAEATVKAQAERIESMRLVGDSMLADYQAVVLRLAKLEAALRYARIHVLATNLDYHVAMPDSVLETIDAALTPTELQEDTQK